MEIMKKKEKCYLITSDESRRIDVLKVWLALMVVFIHSYNEGMKFVGESIQLDVPKWLNTLKYIISNLVSRCAVPAFFVISAVLLYRKEFTWKGNIIKKIRTLVIPYFLLNTFWICFLWLIQQIEWVKNFFPDSGLVISEWNIFHFIDAYAGYTGYPVLYPLWFVRDLFILNLLAKIIQRIIDLFPRFVLCILVIMWMFDMPNGILGIQTQAICFFCLGYYIVKYNIRLSVVDNIDKYIMVFLYLILIALDVATKSGGNVHVIIHQLCIIVGICFWFRCMTKISNAKVNKALLFISKYSFFIYIFHEMSLTVLKKAGMVLLPQTTLFQVLEYFLIPVVIFSCCIVAGFLLEKFLPIIYSLLTGKRKEGM